MITKIIVIIMIIVIMMIMIMAHDMFVCSGSSRAVRSSMLELPKERFVSCTSKAKIHIGI